MAEPTPTDALEPCPFCGGEARHLPGKSGYWIERVICDACHFHLLEMVSHTAVERWNRRAQPAPAASVLEGPQASTIAEAVRDVGKWLNERPNRPLDLRSVAILCAYAQAQAGAVPLDSDDIRTYARNSLGDPAEEAGFFDGVRWAEEQHGIGIKGGQHGAH